MKRLRWVFAAGLLAGAVGAAAYFLDPDRRLEAAVRGLPAYQGRAATAWGRDLGAPDAATRTVAFDKLKDGRADAVPVLVWLLTAGGPGEAQRQSADILGQLSDAARPAAGAILALLDSPDGLVRTTAYKALDRLAPKPGTPLPDELAGVVPALTGRVPDVEAIRVLAAYRTHAAAAVPALRPHLAHADPVVRWNAARTLGKIGPASVPALPDLVAQFADPVAEVREHAAEAVGDIGPPAAGCTPDLVKLIADANWKVRRDAVRALGNFGPPARAALPRVIACQADPQAEVRAAAAVAARKIDPDAAGKP